MYVQLNDQIFEEKGSSDKLIIKPLKSREKYSRMKKGQKKKKVKEKFTKALFLLLCQK